MKEALQRAIEAGYDLKKGIKWPPGLSSWPELEEIAHKVHAELIREDPLFWQALHKALWWAEARRRGEEAGNGMDVEIPSWKESWHRFTDHLAEGKDAENFFTVLLEDNK